MKSLLLSLSFTLAFTLLNGQTQPDNYCGYSGKSEWLTQYQQNPGVYHRSGAITYLPLQLHVVGDDNGAGYFPPQRLLDALCTLNEDFADSEIQFYLKGDFNYIDNSDWYIHNFSGGRQMMRENNVDRAINAYIVEDPAGNCGYFSPGPDALAVAKNCAGKRDKTFAHEVGHYLSLPHPFVGWEGESPERDVNAPDFINGREVEKVDRSNCNRAGDGFCDTGADYISNRWTCNGDSKSSTIYLDPNGEEFQADGTLIMSYSNDQCAHRFSSDQIDAMHANIADERQDLVFNPTPMAPIDPNVNFVLNTPDPANVGVTEALLDWEPVPNATYYLVQVGLVPNMSLIIDQGIVSSTEFLATDLQDGFKHYWRILPFNEYHFCTDYSPVADFETSEETSSVNDLRGVADFKLAPQPVQSNSTLNISFVVNDAQRFNLRLLNLNGQTQHTNYLDAYQGTINYQMNIPDIQAGMYFLEISNEQGEKMVRKVVVR